MKKVNVLILLVAVAVGTFGFIKTNKTEGAVGLNIGNKAPELNYKSPSGTSYALSAVNKNRYVLIDFWASWCGPCRKENPAVVKAYTTFKDKKFVGANAGFTVYSVSLDRGAEPWKAAIAQDGLSWEYHVSDLGYWQSAGAQLYQVQSIPANFLIDGNGVIVAKNLRGAALEEELQKHLAK